MTYSELKIWIINMLVVTLTFTQISDILKLISLLIAIGYSIDKWIILRKNKNKDDEA